MGGCLNAVVGGWGCAAGLLWPALPYPWTPAAPAKTPPVARPPCPDKSPAAHPHSPRLDSRRWGRGVREWRGLLGFVLLDGFLGGFFGGFAVHGQVVVEVFADVDVAFHDAAEGQLVDALLF